MKYFYIGIAIIVIGVGAFFYANQPNSNTITEEETSNPNSVQNNNAAQNSQTSSIKTTRYAFMGTLEEGNLNTIKIKVLSSPGAPKEDTIVVKTNDCEVKSPGHYGFVIDYSPTGGYSCIKVSTPTY